MTWSRALTSLDGSRLPLRGLSMNAELRDWSYGWMGTGYYQSWNWTGTTIRRLTRCRSKCWCPPATCTTQMNLSLAIVDFLPPFFTTNFTHLITSFVIHHIQKHLGYSTMTSSFGIKAKPSRSPYFSLADSTLLIPLREEIAKAEKAATLASQFPLPRRTIAEIFGSAKTLTEDNQAKFLLEVLKNATAFEPNWKQTADSLGTMNGHNV